MFRTRSLTDTQFEIPVSLDADVYTFWVRVHHDDGRMSRWGRGEDLRVVARPETILYDNTLKWEPVEGATHYELLAAELSSKGEFLDRQALHVQLQGSAFQIPENYISASLAFWVRAIQEGDSVTKSPWSRVRLTQDLEFLASPAPTLFENYEITVCQGIPPSGFTCPSQERYIGLVVAINDVEDAQTYEVFASEKNGTERRRYEIPSYNRSSHYAQLPRDIALETHEIWVRAVGEGLAHSRWVQLKTLSPSNP